MGVGLIQSEHHTHPRVTFSWRDVVDTTLCDKVCQ